MMVTKPAAGDPNWDVPLNAALDELQGDIDTNAASISSVSSRVTTLENIGTFTPADHSLITWSYDPALGAAGSSATAGVLFLAKVLVRQAANVTNILLGVVTQGTTLTAGQNFAGLYDSTGTLLGSTADQATGWSSGGAGLRTMAISGGPLALSAGAHYVAFLANGSTPPTFLRANSQSSSMINVGLASGTGRFLSSGTGQTALPASVTLTSASTSNLAWWAALS